MENITFQIDGETYRKALVRAEKEGTSVTALVRNYLVSLAGDEESLEKHRKIVETLQKIYAEADARPTTRREALVPLTREEIYAERLR